MILLLGGTSETATLATALVEAGYRVLVSTATDVALDVGNHPGIRRRTGRLNEDAMAALVREQDIVSILDATHPYATLVQTTAQKVAELLAIPYFRWLRPGTIIEDQKILFAADHQHAAHIACSFGRPVLLTTGSKNLEPYVHEACRVGVPLIVRVLGHPESLEACRLTGIDELSIISGRGPFSKEENLAVIRKFDIGVLVTKDSGIPGGVRSKIEAAQLENCQVVIVQRPEHTVRMVFDSVRDLLEAVSRTIPCTPHNLRFTELCGSGRA
ncbi:MAG: precorrin-6A reductase [Syntrophobacteraceae bacterium]|jgi:precorrin-6A/cobalt-precorrin-6A reductase